VLGSTSKRPTLHRLLPLLRRRLLLEKLGDLQVDTRRKRTLGAYARAIFVEKEWHRREEKRDPAEERRGPVGAQVDKHLRCEKWERGACRGTDDGMTSKRRRRIHEVGVYQVALSTSTNTNQFSTVEGDMSKTHDERDEHKRDRQPDEDRAQPGHPPGDAFIVSTPAKPEDTDHQNGTANHGRVQALLRGRESVPLLDETRVCAQEPEVHKGSEDRPDANTDEHETVVRDRKVARTYENHGKRLKHCATKPGSETVQLLYRDDGTYLRR
jgi:hypothetical protein